jgi:hypothetical protein
MEGDGRSLRELPPGGTVGGIGEKLMMLTILLQEKRNPCFYRDSTDGQKQKATQPPGGEIYSTRISAGDKHWFGILDA